MPQRQRFLSIYDEHASAIYRYLIWVTRNEQLAEDLLQLCFEKLWNKLNSGSEPVHVVNWLRLVGTNLAKDHYKSAKYKKEAVIEPEYLAESSNGWNPEKALLYKEMEKELALILLDLEPKNRQVVYALDVEGLGYAQAGVKLGMSERALRNIRQKAWHKIRRELQKRRFPAEILEAIPVR